MIKDKKIDKCMTISEKHINKIKKNFMVNLHIIKNI